MLQVAQYSLSDGGGGADGSGGDGGDDSDGGDDGAGGGDGAAGGGASHGESGVTVSTQLTSGTLGIQSLDCAGSSPGLGRSP